MASIRYRVPWRVMVKGDKQPKGVFVSNNQAEALKKTLMAQGIDKKSIKVVQERKGTWEARVRRQGGKVLLKSFPTKARLSKVPSWTPRWPTRPPLANSLNASPQSEPIRESPTTPSVVASTPFSGWTWAC